MNLVDERQKIMQRRMAEMPELSYSTYCEYGNGKQSDPQDADVGQADDVSVTNHTIRLGSETFSSVQVHNALFIAIIDCVEGKSGFVAKMDGKAKKRKI